MSYLSVYHVSTPDTPNKVLTHFDDIASTLAENGVRFERWQASTKVEPGTSHAEVIAAYQAQIDTLSAERGYVSVDVISVGNNHPQKAELHASFLDERHHGEDEVRFFVAGRGLLSVHLGDCVYAVSCEKNDVLSIPAGTRHWFDMGEQPHLVVIRLFNKRQGEASFTGDDIASRFPGLDD